MTNLLRPTEKVYSPDQLLAAVASGQNVTHTCLPRGQRSSGARSAPQADRCPSLEGQSPIVSLLKLASSRRVRLTSALKRLMKVKPVPMTYVIVSTLSRDISKHLRRLQLTGSLPIPGSLLSFVEQHFAELARQPQQCMVLEQPHRAPAGGQSVS